MLSEHVSLASRREAILEDGTSTILVIRPRKLSNFGFGFSYSKKPLNPASARADRKNFVLTAACFVLRLVSPSRLAVST